MWRRKQEVEFQLKYGKFVKRLKKNSEKEARVKISEKKLREGTPVKRTKNLLTI